MKIKEISKEILSENSNSIFLSIKWLSIFNDALKCYGIYNNEQKIIGGFTLYNEKKIGLITYYRNPLYSPTINLFFKNKSQNKSKILSENKKLLMTLADFFSHLPYHILSVYLPGQFTDMQPFFWKGFKTIPNYTYIIDLKEDIQVIEKNFSTKRRNDIKKAIHDGVESKISHDHNITKELVLNTFNRKQKSINENIIDKILFNFADNSNSFSFISYQDNKPIAGSFYIYDQQKIYYLLGGYNNNNKHNGAGALSIFNAIKYAKKSGIDKFDFEGSMIPEVEKFFRGFGGNLVPYYSINRAKMPIEIMLKFVKRSMY